MPLDDRIQLATVASFKAAVELWPGVTDFRMQERHHPTEQGDRPYDCTFEVDGLDVAGRDQLQAFLSDHNVTAVRMHVVEKRST